MAVLALMLAVPTMPVALADEPASKSFREVGEWKLEPKSWQPKLHLESISFAPDEEMILEIALVNISKLPGTLLHSPIPILDYDISVTDAAGHEVKYSPEGKKLFQGGSVVGGYHFEVVQPSQSSIQKVDLRKFFDLSVAGKYRVTVSRYETVYRTSKSSMVKSSADFRVAPKLR
jgi:hypothetical protein